MKLNNQEVFNPIWVHFVQNKMPRSVRIGTEGVACFYRLDKTANCPIRCAAGVLVKDEDYGACVMEHEGRVAGYVPYFRERIESAAFLNLVQEIHDCEDTPIEDGLRKLANSACLSLPCDWAGRYDHYSSLAW